jgi:histidine triad (HIT) family protein
MLAAFNPRGGEMADNCLFCKMVSGDIKPSLVYDDADVMAFNDINPQAPLHALVIPKRHIATLNDTTADDASLLGKLITTATRIAREAGVADGGYRVVMNCNADAGQSVFHIHLHVLGGRHMRWPPG